MSQDLVELRNMWNSQKKFNSNFVNFDSLDFSTRQEMTKEYVLHLLSEATSLLESVNWKMHHRKDSIEVNRSDVLLEIIDVWKYLLSIGLLWDMTPEEFVSAYEEKSQLVEQRYLQEFAQISNKEIVICDIDGVLSDYPDSFLKFVGSYVGVNEGVDLSVRGLKSLDLYDQLSDSVGAETIKACKHLYRSTGKSRYEKVNEGAVSLLRSLKEKGLYIVLLTSRPFDSYRSLYLDTYIWLEENNIPFDMLLNDSKKRGKVSELLEKSDVRFLIDDDPRIVNNLVGLEKLRRVYLRNRPYNEGCTFKGDKVVRFSDFSEILEKEGLYA